MARIEDWLPEGTRDSPEYRIARTHRSAGAPHNERLEFLGDALLGLVVSEILYRRFPDLSEGDLTRLRAHLVCRSMLAQVAEDAQLDQALIAGDLSSSRARRAAAGNALEAVVASVYVTRGLEEARVFIERLYGRLLEDLPSPDSLRGAKNSLQEHLQARGRTAHARYTLLRERPRGESPRFEVLCEVEDPAVRARGMGERVREAEQDAAAAALAQVRRRLP